MPATAGTRHLVDATLLRALPPRAVFVNPGRGTVVDDAAVAEALQAGRLAGAVLDVFRDGTAAARPRVLAHAERDHHVAYRGGERAGWTSRAVFVDNYRRWIAGEPLRYQVDFAAGY